MKRFSIPELLKQIENQLQNNAITVWKCHYERMVSIPLLDCSPPIGSKSLEPTDGGMTWRGSLPLVCIQSVPNHPEKG